MPIDDHYPVGFPVSFTSSQTTALEKSFATHQSSLQTALISLSKQNGQLKTALINQTSCSKKRALLYTAIEKNLEKRILFFQQQMQQVARIHQETTQRFENLLAVVQEDQTTALDLAKQTWAQEKRALLSQNQALQNEQRSLINQRDSLYQEQYKLKKQIDEEPIRQQEAIKAKVALVKESFISMLDEEMKIASDPARLKAAGGGRPADVADGKGAMIYLRKQLVRFFGNGPQVLWRS